MRKALRPLLTLAKQVLYPWYRLDAPMLYSVSPERTMEMVFNSKKKTGGWVDRVKGMISCLEIARQSGRVLIIHVDKTFPIDKYFDTNDPQVRFQVQAVRWPVLQTTFYVSNDRRRPSFLTLRHSRRKHIFVDTNMDFIGDLYPAATEEDVNKKRAELFNAIFRLKQAFRDKAIGSVPANAVAVHTRFTSLLGDFKDVVDRPLSGEKRQNLIDTCCRQLLTIAERHPGSAILLFSDSKIFLDIGCALSPRITTLAGTPKHIDHTDDHDDAMEKTLLDFFALTHCPIIYLLLNEPMYNSNFSRYAAIFGNGKFLIEK